MLYLVALAKASRPASHSWAQMDSFSLEELVFGDSSPSLSILSPRSTSSCTNVALFETSHANKIYVRHTQRGIHSNECLIATAEVRNLQNYKKRMTPFLFLQPYLENSSSLFSTHYLGRTFFLVWCPTTTVWLVRRVEVGVSNAEKQKSYHSSYENFPWVLHLAFSWNM